MPEEEGHYRYRVNLRLPFNTLEVILGLRRGSIRSAHLKYEHLEIIHDDPHRGAYEMYESNEIPINTLDLRHGCAACIWVGEGETPCRHPKGNPEEGFIEFWKGIACKYFKWVGFPEPEYDKQEVCQEQKE